MKKYLKLMRVHHYLKNFLVFVPLFFSGDFTQMEPLLTTIFSFIAFCLVTSVVYIINDISDVEEDRLHPTKCKRPLASGAISITTGKFLAVGLLVAAFLILVLCKINSVGPYISLLVYLLLNLAYSKGLKHYPIIDIVILSSGFVLRVVYGATVNNITISNWLYLTIIAGSLYLGLGKRRNELQRLSHTSRKVLKHYNINFLDKNMTMAMTLATVFYALWTVDPLTVQKTANNYLVLTVPLILIILMKYSLNIEGDSDGDPVEVILKDKILVGLVLSYVLIVVGILYVA